MNKTTEKWIPAKTKQLEEFRRYLEKLKIEFQNNYKTGTESIGSCTLSDFEVSATLGLGAFGSVILSRNKTDNKYYAVKILNKTKVTERNQIQNVFNEKYVLSAIRFPFCIHMEYSFKDNCNVYFVLPFIAGGDMFSLLRTSRKLKEKDAQFYAAQVILGLEYLHFLDLIYRDLKPENIVIDIDGYIKLADFGFTKMVKLRTYTLCGSPEYLAPEIILSKGYNKAVDWWSFGIFMYEMIAGFTPFHADEPMEIYEKIVAGKYQFTADFSNEARNLSRNILQIDLSRRYGNLLNGVNDIKMHAWLKLIDWQAIYSRRAIPPFVPKINGPADTSNFDHFGGVQIQGSINEKYPKEFEEF